MSLGINLLAALVKRVAQSLDDDFDIEILEMHHRPRSMRIRYRHSMLGEAPQRAARYRSTAIPRADATADRCAQKGYIGFASLRVHRHQRPQRDFLQARWNASS